MANVYGSLPLVQLFALCIERGGCCCEAGSTFLLVVWEGQEANTRNCFVFGGNTKGDTLQEIASSPVR